MPTPKSPISKRDHSPLNHHTSDHHHHPAEKLIPKTRTTVSPKSNATKTTTALSSSTWHGEEKKMSPSTNKKGSTRSHRSSSRRRGGKKSSSKNDNNNQGLLHERFNESAPTIVMTMSSPPSTTAPASPRRNRDQQQQRVTTRSVSPSSPPFSAFLGTPIVSNKNKNATNNTATTTTKNMNDIRAQNRRARSQSPPIKITLSMDNKHTVRLLQRQSEIPDDYPLASPLKRSNHNDNTGRRRYNDQSNSTSVMKTYMGSSNRGQHEQQQRRHEPITLKELSASLPSLGNGTSHHSMKSSGSSGTFSIPNLYRYARKGKWDDFVTALLQSSSEGLRFVYKKDGTTALHLAVMSRTGYIDSFRSSSSSSSGGGSNSTKPSSAAPLDVIEELLAKEPQLAKVKCTLNGYTPLAYACLVCNPQYNTDDAASMVRLFIHYCPDATKVFTDDGLSPVDIHIVSFSHHHKDKEEDSALGKTSTSVLRTLLSHAPDLANLRLVKSNGGQVVDGPLELLYKCNMAAFSKASLEDIYDSEDDGTIQSDYTMPEKRQQVVDVVKTWWLWTWTVLLLKYGWKANNKKPGVWFSAVHTAALQVGLPTPIMMICLYAFPRQVKNTIDDIENLGNLPLHSICSWPCHQDNVIKCIGDAMVSVRKITAIDRVLEEFPPAIKISNAKGEYPLEIAIKSGTTWDGGIRKLVKANPEALKHQSRVTGLYPFMTAAAAAIESASAESSEPSHSQERKELRHVRTIYGLLRSNPKVIKLALQL
jgi:hypothetical protein